VTGLSGIAGVAAGTMENGGSGIARSRPSPRFAAGLDEAEAAGD